MLQVGPPVTLEQAKIRNSYLAAREKLFAVARTYRFVPEADKQLDAKAVEALKEAAVDFANSEKEAWENDVLFEEDKC